MGSALKLSQTVNKWKYFPFNYFSRLIFKSICRKTAPLSFQGAQTHLSAGNFVVKRGGDGGKDGCTQLCAKGPCTNIRAH